MTVPKVRGPLMCGSSTQAICVFDTSYPSLWLKCGAGNGAGCWCDSCCWLDKVLLVALSVHGRSCLFSVPLEEGGVRGKGTCKSEVLLGEHTVHALWQGFGVGRRPRHSGPQDELPAYRRWEVGCRVLSPLLWVA